jgi:hypothetical protein
MEDDEKKTSQPKIDSADAILKRRHLLDDDHLPALVERFVVGIFVFSWNFLNTLLLSTFKPVAISKHLLRERNQNLLLASPVMFVTASVFAAHFLISELTRYDRTNEIREIVLGSATLPFSEMLFEFLPNLILIFIAFIVLSNVGSKLCKKPKTDLFRLLCYFYGSNIIVLKILFPLINQADWNILGISAFNLTGNLLENYKYVDGNYYYVYLSILELLIIFFFFCAAVIGNGTRSEYIKKPLSLLKVGIFFITILASYLLISTVNLFFTSLTIKTTETVDCRGASFIKTQNGFKINTVLTNNTTSQFFLSGHVTGMMEMINKPSFKSSSSRLVTEVILRGRVSEEKGNISSLMSKSDIKMIIDSNSSTTDILPPGYEVAEMSINNGNTLVLPPKKSIGITLTYKGETYSQYNFIHNIKFYDLLDSARVRCFNSNRDNKAVYMSTYY